MQHAHRAAAAALTALLLLAAAAPAVNALLTIGGAPLSGGGGPYDPGPVLIANVPWSLIEASIDAGVYMEPSRFPVFYVESLLAPWCLNARLASITYRYGNPELFYILSGAPVIPYPNATIVSPILAIHNLGNDELQVQAYGLARIAAVLKGRTLTVNITLFPVAKPTIPVDISLIPITIIYESTNVTNFTIDYTRMLKSGYDAEDMLRSTLLALYTNGSITAVQHLSYRIEVPLTTRYVEFIAHYASMYIPITGLATAVNIYRVANDPASFLPSPSIIVNGRAVAATSRCLPNGFTLHTVYYTNKQTYIKSFNVAVLAGPFLYYMNTTMYGVPGFYIDIFTVHLPSTLYIPAGGTAVFNVRVLIYRK